MGSSAQLQPPARVPLATQSRSLPSAATAEGGQGPDAHDTLDVGWGLPQMRALVEEHHRYNVQLAAKPTRLSLIHDKEKWETIKEAVDDNLNDENFRPVPASNSLQVELFAWDLHSYRCKSQTSVTCAGKLINR